MGEGGALVSDVCATSGSGRGVRLGEVLERAWSGRAWLWEVLGRAERGRGEQAMRGWGRCWRGAERG